MTGTDRGGGIKQARREGVWIGRGRGCSAVAIHLGFVFRGNEAPETRQTQCFTYQMVSKNVQALVYSKHFKLRLFSTLLSCSVIYVNVIFSPQQAPPASPSGHEDWPFLREPWLKPKNIMDRAKRRPDHPEYDPRTLSVPDSFLAQQTPVRLHGRGGKGGCVLAGDDCVLCVGRG